MNGSWIYFNESRRLWQVKYWDAQRGAVVLAEYPNRGDAFVHAAFNIPGDR